MEHKSLIGSCGGYLESARLLVNNVLTKNEGQNWNFFFGNRWLHCEVKFENSHYITAAQSNMHIHVIIQTSGTELKANGECPD